jgi:hypothetical protein
MRLIDWEGTEDGAAQARGVPMHTAAGLEFNARGTAHPVYCNVYLSHEDRQAIDAKVRLLDGSGATITTTEAALRDGDVVYVATAGQRRPHRIRNLRRGARARDSAELRIGELEELEQREELAS